MENIKHKIIRHKNPNGSTTWYRAVYYDEKGRVHKSPCYHCGNCGWARRSAQNWLYANIHIWCKIAHVAAIEELKGYFRKTKYSKCYQQHKEEIDYLVAHSNVSLKKLNYILRETSKFADLYDITTD